MNLLIRILKFFQSEAHALVSKFEDPVKLIEQGIRDLKKDFETLQSEYYKLKGTTLQLFEVEVYLHALKSITYNITASSPDEAEQVAINIFKDKNKDFLVSDIELITVKPMSCAR